MNSYIEKNALEKYNSFLNQIQQILCEENIEKSIDSLKKETNEQKIKRLDNLYYTLSDDKLFNLFLRCKIKLFSTKEKSTQKVSESLFGESMTLKKIFNNRSSDVKKVLWKYLHLLYLLNQSNKETYNEERAKLISDKLNQLDNNDNTVDDDLSNKVKKKLFNSSFNKTTNNMIDDIVNSFQSSLNSKQTNPFESIMNISQKISEKYKGDINSGHIEMDKLMENIQSSVPGMSSMMNNFGKKSKKKEKVIIDENFSTSQVELGVKDNKKSGFNIGNMLKVAGNLMGNKSDKNNENSADLSSLMNLMNRAQNINNDEDASALKEDLNKCLSGFGIDMNEFNKRVEITENILQAENVLQNVKDTIPDVEN